MADVEPLLFGELLRRYRIAAGPGVGTGAVTYLRTLGQTLGVAVVGAVKASSFSDALSGRLPARLQQLPPDTQAQLTNQALLQKLLGDPAQQSQLIAQATTRVARLYLAAICDPALVAHAQRLDAVASQFVEEPQVVAQVGRREEVVSHLFATTLGESFGRVRVAQDL